MKRALAVLALLLLTTGGRMPVAGSARQGCAMCSKQCCCGPQEKSRHCSIRRTCRGAPEAANAAPLGVTLPALLPRPTAVPPPAGAGGARQSPDPRLLEADPSRPDPPPRPAA
jgi:hypothetical protein